MRCEASPFRASNRNALHINWTSNAFALKQVQLRRQIGNRDRETEIEKEE